MNKIILAITGSIASYKCIDLAKELAKDNEVKVIMTPNTLNFINPQIFKYFNIECHVEDFNKSGVFHIELARWASHFVVCPASANTLAKISSGLADNLLTTLAISLDHSVVKILVPAMNPEMYKSIPMKENKERLINQGWNIIEPDIGKMACEEIGIGKMPSIECLKDIIPTFSNKNIFQTMLITAGATIEPIDSFRYITNPAKGGTSYLMALKALEMGYRIHVIKGKNSLKQFDNLLKNPRCTMETVISTHDLLTSVSSKISKIHYYLSPMAVGDIHIKNSSSGKIKKKDMKALEIEVNPDVLRYVIDNKNEHTKIVGFAAESELNMSVVKEKVERKPVDLLVANLANSGLTGQEQKGFNQKFGEYWFVKNNDLTHIEKSDKMNKKDLVNYILEFITKE